MSEKTVQQRQMWSIFFFLGLIMINFPFLQIFNRTETCFGIPLLVLYLFIGWPLSIGIIFLFSRTLELPDEDKPSEKQ
ncbi:MAG: hypothetical protein JXR59_01370 [Desulfuromonadaceae bacterium]|nr:hypothetical protein [Desulfuromonadaceae bacterium]